MSIEKKIIGKLSDGQTVEAYLLKNSNGMAAEILTYGCRIARLYVPDRNGKIANVVLGHSTISEYEKSGDLLGATIGRYANRIGGAEVKINSKVYHMNKNDGRNSLHSAPGGYQNKNWKACPNDESGGPSVTLSYFNRNGESGFPGNVNAQVTYSISQDNALTICYAAKTDAETPYNPTNHTYFNITGNADKSILPLKMKIYADCITETTDELIPTGKFVPVKGTPYDFTEFKEIGRDIENDDRLLSACGGYDVNFVLKGPNGDMRKAAVLLDEESGRKMLVFTDMPGLQVFTANNFPAGSVGTDGRELKAHHAVCLETQFFPDSVHQPLFPYKNITPDRPFKSTTIYKFVTD